MPTQTWNYTGSVQQWTAPPNVVSPIYVEVLGPGGPFTGDGTGGKVTGWLNVNGGDVLNLYCGGVGGAPPAASGGFTPSAGGDPGWNGGGIGGRNSNGGQRGYGGSGASDIRINGTSLSLRACVAGGAGATGRTGSAGAKGSGGSGAGPVGQGGGNAPGTGGGNGGLGGSQTAGGAGGTRGDGTASGGDGSLGQGGDAGNSATSTINAGGAGGGGYYGGGAGGNGNTNYGGAGGAGGSNYIGGFRTDMATTNTRTGSAQGDPGQISITYTVRDPLTATSSIVSTGGMSIGAVDITTSGLPLKTVTSLSVDGSKTVPSLSTFVTTAQMITSPGPSLLFSGLPMSTRAALSLTGFRVTTNSVNINVQASLLAQETSGKAFFLASTALNLTGKQGFFAVLPMQAVSSVNLAGQLTQKNSIALSGQTSLRMTGTDLLSQALTMAARASVSQSGRVVEMSGVLMYPQVSLNVSARIKSYGQVPIFVASAFMKANEPIRHPFPLAVSAQGSMTIAPKVFVLVGPQFAAQASLIMNRPFTSHIIRLGSLASMIVDDSTVLLPPYLHVPGGPADMDFFVTSVPIRGDLRQVMQHVR